MTDNKDQPLKAAGAEQDDDAPLTQEELQRLVEEYDTESNFRRLAGPTALLVTVLGVTLSLFHVYTAGFGVFNEIVHRSVHLAFVVPLIFLCVPRKKEVKVAKNWLFSIGFAAFYAYITYDLYQSLPENPLSGIFLAVMAVLILMTLPWPVRSDNSHKVIWRDWIFAIIGAGFSVYLIFFFKSIFVEHVGDPGPDDYMMGVLAIVMVLEAGRRTMGPVLPVIGIICLLYALFGPYFPGIFGHRGYNILRIVNHLYVGTEGIYGIALGVTATYVFHFVLFGILAQASGLGQLFIDLASMIAGRQAGGSAKVSVVSSGFFGMISGSPIANTVTTGSFTIPLMKKTGFTARFAAAVEASASCGGQITPPIMGASAFVMAEMLGIPYNKIILIAIVPAAFHYFAILLMVHLEAKRLGLKGMDASQIPKLGAVIGRQWHLFIPLVVMVTLLIMQFTPFLAAFYGIMLTIAFSYVPWLRQKLGNKTIDTSGVLFPKRLVTNFEAGAKYSLAITAACACVGFILGITTLTGLGFKLSGAVVTSAQDLAGFIHSFDVTGLLTVPGMTLFFGLIFVAVACILMGAGLPTTPTYIILASITAPALNDLGVPLVATHFFVFYFGVLADVTPPVALAAYAGAGIARSDPTQTGMTAFRLSMGKALVPFMFVYAPSLLFVDFSFLQFTTALLSGILCVVALSAAYIGHFKVKIATWQKILLTIGGLFLIGNAPILLAIGAALVLLVLVPNFMKTPPAAMSAS
ncbi:MAG: TRAP transporter permease [Alphaproteobacteria bacterium]|nr:MAG: TRAP transporter permease [Alphaproteobacteria bacterium]